MKINLCVGFLINQDLLGDFSFPDTYFFISGCFVLLALAVWVLRNIVIHINDRWKTKGILDIKLIFSHVL